MPRLALDAARRGRLGVQPLEADLGAAVDADPVGAFGEALARRLHLAQLPEVARELGIAKVGEQRGNGFVAQVVHRAGELAEALLAQAAGVAPELFQEKGAALLERAAQLVVLPGFHGHSVAAVPQARLTGIKCAPGHGANFEA